MTMKFYFPRPWFIKVNIPATEFTANSFREGTVPLPETAAILQCLLAFSYDHTGFMEKMPMSNPIKWSCDYSRAWLIMVNVPARLYSPAATPRDPLANKSVEPTPSKDSAFTASAISSSLLPELLRDFLWQQIAYQDPPQRRLKITSFTTRMKSFQYKISPM